MSSIGFYNAVSGSMAQLQKLDVVANNLANANTPGFKSDKAVFAEILKGKNRNVSLPKMIETHTTNEQAPLIATSSPLDIGITGPGYFQIQTKGGDTAYTRRGSFVIDADGEVALPSGEKLLAGGGPIALDSANINVGLTGEILNDQGAVIAILETYEFDAPIRKIGSGFIVGERNPAVSENTTLHQGMIEGSNVNTMLETTEMIKTQRTFDSLGTVIKAYGDIARKTTQIADF